MSAPTPEGSLFALARSPLFQGLALRELHEVAWAVRLRRFDAGDVLCRAGESGKSMWVIVDGLARVLAPAAPGAPPRVLSRLRSGEEVGVMSLVTGEPRSATVVAAVPTTAFELDEGAWAEVAAGHPAVLRNLAKILAERLVGAEARGARRSEAVALLVAQPLADAVPALLESARTAGARGVAVVNADSGTEEALDQLDELLAEHGTVLIIAGLDGDERRLKLMLDHVDRAVAIVPDLRSGEALGQLTAGTGMGAAIELVHVSDGPSAAPPNGSSGRSAGPSPRLVRTFGRAPDGSLPERDVRWLGRHLTRTKLGLALGAGGAKGYAHVGVLEVLEREGYTVDCVSGSSIGAVVGTHLALGGTAHEIGAALRSTFTPETVAEMFSLSLAGTSTGLDTVTAVFRETTGQRTFDDTEIPLGIMTVDLAGRCPAPIHDGPLWQALLAATALPGMFPPYERDGARLVDGLALVPVPTLEAVELGADVTVSVNLMSPDTLPAWPGEAVPEPSAPRRRARMLDTLLEVMDLAQLDSSVRHAALADVAITPRFGPSSWRDFDHADRFLTAGRQAAEEALPAIRALARPQSTTAPAPGGRT